IPSQLRLYSKQGLDTVRQRSQSLLDRATHEISQLGAYLNHVTGYDEVEGLKQQVVEQESKMGQARTEAREAKVAYSNAVLSRSTSQRQLNDLLQRKQSWTDDDVLQFTSLVRSDHASTVSETNAKRTMDEAEERVEKEFDALMRVILARYHVEQVWSDKIRRASSYGSLGVMGLNLLVFVAAILFVEPWKRKRLAETFEKKVDALQEEMRTDLSLLTSQVSALPHTPTTAPPPQPSPPTPLPVESPSRSMVAAWPMVDVVPCSTLASQWFPTLHCWLGCS
ncbi:Mdm33 family-domain-containing protein, partial [Flagelloscypha sp. PMI_526]